MKNKAYLIVANGNFLAKTIIQEIAQNKIIIALDQAADKLFHLGIMPHILLGDFDCSETSHINLWGIQCTISELTDDSPPYLGRHGVKIIPRKNQNFTDIMKAIHYCHEQQAKSIDIICANGGRLDHHEAALRSLRTEYKKDCEIRIHTEQQTLRFVKDESFIINGEINDKCALLAFPHAIVSSQGLLYEVSQYRLNFGYSESIANSLRLPQANIVVQGEALIMLPPQFSAQREFINKSNSEQLKILLSEIKE